MVEAPEPPPSRPATPQAIATALEPMIERCITTVVDRIDARLQGIEAKVDLVAHATRLLADKVAIVETWVHEHTHRIGRLEELTGSFSKKAVRKAAKYAPPRKR